MRCSICREEGHSRTKCPRNEKVLFRIVYPPYTTVYTPMFDTIIGEEWAKGKAVMITVSEVRAR
jgi:hypothetical protein